MSKEEKYTKEMWRKNNNVQENINVIHNEETNVKNVKFYEK